MYFCHRNQQNSLVSVIEINKSEDPARGFIYILCAITNYEKSARRWIACGPAPPAPSQPKQLTTYFPFSFSLSPFSLSLSLSLFPPFPPSPYLPLSLSPFSVSSHPLLPSLSSSTSIIKILFHSSKTTVGAPIKEKG